MFWATLCSKGNVVMMKTNDAWQRLRRPMVGLAMCLIVLAFAVSPAVSDTIKMSDGEELEGTLKPIGSGSYVQIKTEDGQIRLVSAAKIESVNGAPYGAAGGDGEGAGSARTGLGREYQSIKDRADRVDEPVRAVDLWERFLKQENITPAEKEAGEAELAEWKKLYQDGAEKLRGAWVSGEEIEKIKEEANDLVDQALEQERNNNVLDAERNYRKALNIYPNSFRAHYRLAYIAFHQGYGNRGGNRYLRQAERHSRAALKLQPELPAVLSSMGAVLFALDEYEEGTELMWQAVQKAETDLTVGNLLTVLNAIPRRWLDANRTLRNINLQADSLRGEYNPTGLIWIEDYTHGVEDMNPDDPDMGPPGMRGNGSGFFVTSDGYVITNRHVAETDEGMYYRIRLSEKDEDGNFIEYPARFIASDDKYDVALLKVDLPEGEEVEFFHLLQEDVPPIQADVMTAGYPTVGTGNFVFQTARGTVSSNETGDEEFDLYLDMKTTQGNSGGPIFNRNGHVVGITTAYRKIYDSIVSLAVGPRQIRDFLEGVEEAPTLEYDSETDREFEPVALAAEVKSKTVLVLIFAGEAEELDGSDSGDDSGDSGDSGEDGGSEEEEDSPEMSPEMSQPGQGNREQRGFK